MKHAQNPTWLEKAVSDKASINKILPEKYQIRVYSNGESPISSTGLWVIKPRFAYGGEGIFLSDNSTFQKHFIGSILEKTHVAQEFISACPSENDSRTDNKSPSSGRLLWDFAILENGTIHIYLEAGYQRVMRDTTPGKFIVNKAQGAKSVPFSQEELALARMAADDVLMNIWHLHKTGVM